MSSVMRFDEWQDSDGNPVFNGAGGPLATPAILQVVSTTKTDTQATGGVVSGNQVVIAGLEATITPTTTTNKVLVFVSAVINSSVPSVSFVRTVGFSVERNGSPIGGHTTPGVRVQGFGGTKQASGSTGHAATNQFLDSPGSVSAQTYTVKIHNTDDQTATLFVNRGVGDDNLARSHRGVSTITLMEVAG